MSQSKYEIVMVDEVSTSRNILLLPALKQHDVWILSVCVKPAILIHRFLAEERVQGLHLVGEFYSGGFKMSDNRLLSFDDFPAFDTDQFHRFITFWCNATDSAKGINEVFVNTLLKRTRMSLSASVRTSETGYSKTILKFPPHPYIRVGCQAVVMKYFESCLTILKLTF